MAARIVWKGVSGGRSVGAAVAAAVSHESAFHRSLASLLADAKAATGFVDQGVLDPRRETKR